MYKALTTAAFVGLACTAAQAALVNPTNNDFQTDVVDGFSSGTITGWTKTGGGSGIVDGGANYPGGPSNQSAVIFSTGTRSLESGLGTVDAGSNTYTLSFLNAQNALGGSIAGTTIVQILVDGVIIETYDALPGIPPQSAGPVANPDSFDFTIDTADVGVDAGDAVVVRFESNLTSGQWVFDDVSVALVPEPGSLALLGLGGLLAFRRRRG